MGSPILIESHTGGKGEAARNYLYTVPGRECDVSTIDDSGAAKRSLAPPFRTSQFKTARQGKGNEHTKDDAVQDYHRKRR